MSTTTGATSKKAWVIAADPDFTRMEGGAIITTGATVYSDEYVIASAADVATVPTAEEIAAMRWISVYPFSRSEVASKCRAVFSAYLERVTG